MPRTKHPARTGFRGLVALAIEAYEDYSEIRGCGAGRCASSTSSLEEKKVSSRPGSGGSRLLGSRHGLKIREFLNLWWQGSESYNPNLRPNQWLYNDIGLPLWFNGKGSACQCRSLGFNPWVRKIPWRRKWQPTPVFLSGRSNGQRSLAGYSPGSCKSWIRLND